MGRHRLPNDLRLAMFPAAGKGWLTPAGYLLGWGATVPTDSVTTDNYAPGALFFHIDGATQATTIYQNVGTSILNNFDALMQDWGASGLKTDVIAESTAAAGVTADGVVHKDGGERFPVGSDTGAVALSFGLTATEGAEVKVIEETVDLTAAGAKFVAMTTAIPAGAVILSAQANIEVLAVAGGTTAKIALGLNAGDVDKYGKTSALTKNLKVDTVPDWAVLAAEEQIDVCGVIADGSALGDTNLSAGSVRVRVVYLELNSLDDAA